jgi:hypothetical protein
VAATERLAAHLALRTSIIPLGRTATESNHDSGSSTAKVAADPTNVDMDHVAATMRTIEDSERGRRAPQDSDESN